MKTWKQAVNEAFEIREQREYAITIEKQAITIYLADDVKCIIRRDGEHAQEAAFEGDSILSPDEIQRRVRMVWNGCGYHGMTPYSTAGAKAALSGFIADEFCRWSPLAKSINTATFAVAWDGARS